METLGKITLTIILGTLSSIFGGFVLSKIWIWLLVPTFGFREISTIHGMILILVISLFTFTLIKKDKEVTMKSISASVLGNIFVYAYILLVGYIYSLFI